MGILPAERVRDEISRRERVFGNYEDGRRFAWFLEIGEKFEKPIRAKGNRMLWEWKPEATEFVPRTV